MDRVYQYMNQEKLNFYDEKTLKKNIGTRKTCYIWQEGGTLLGMVSVFQENRVRIHVKFVFAWKTVRLFPMQTKRKHNKIIPSVFAQKWKTV